MSGFGSHFSSEALPDALPKNQNSPQICPYGLYAEQLSGTAFTAPRHRNQRSWFYRIRPSVSHLKFKLVENSPFRVATNDFIVTPAQLRWDPMPLIGIKETDQQVDFIDGLVQICAAGDPALKEGLSVYNYAANKSMQNKAFYNSDGDFLIVPQQGSLSIRTEFGIIIVEPREIAVIQRGIKFAVSVSESCRGYILETYKGHFELPTLGPIGANGLANPRDFDTPTASFEDRDVENYCLVNKYMGSLFEASMTHSPFDVVAWHGNYAPYKYDLRKFMTINSVSFDHPDPSIYTVLTCPSDEPGTAVADFVIFPPRWTVMDHTFRPPYYHRNCMTEYMGMIYGQYDAKKAGKGGFQPGGASLHSCMSAHGPDRATFLAASAAPLQPQYLGDGLAFMFETCYMLRLHPQAMTPAADHDTPKTASLCPPRLQARYADCWAPMPKLFDGSFAPAL